VDSGVFSSNMDFYCAVEYEFGLGDLVQDPHPQLRRCGYFQDKELYIERYKRFTKYLSEDMTFVQI
jgi:hypothetical protein